MNHVFATETRIVSHPGTGIGVTVNIGEHWPADDPVVEAYPGLFTDDARYGLRSSLPIGDDGYPVAAEQKPAKAAKAAKTGGRGRGGRRGRAAATETATSAPGERRSRTVTSPREEKAEADPKQEPDAKPGQKTDAKTSDAK